MQDVDLLVHPEHLHRSVELVSGLGYEVTEAMSGLLCEEYHLEPEGELGVDLHPYALIESADDSDIWEAKIPLGLKGVDAWAPCPADSLCSSALMDSAGHWRNRRRGWSTPQP